MALIAVNATDAAIPPHLAARAATLPPDAPIVVMVHGFRFSPSLPSACPHHDILSLVPMAGARHAVSWPRGLGFSADGDEGLAVGFGWEARGSLRRAYRQAAQAGQDLATLVTLLATAARRPVAIIAHSLEARVALSALASVAPGVIGRVVLLAAAEFRDRAEAAAASPAGILAEIVNVTSRENDLYDLALEVMLRGGLGRAVGQGLSRRRDNWVDVQIDDADTITGLAQIGFSIGTTAHRICHWSPYMRDGVFDLYRAILCTNRPLSLIQLRQAADGHSSRRWSRLLEWPHSPGSFGRA
ncbi:MAG: hypothetical protein DI498_08090 [Paracoccus denitrificans]|nr:MAG: hypothetical protein DI498_08090 [Paracoccus denitrificans]PZO84474.1 MAG: hypothetical protein DI633_08090 [Paracoccus denitrificans]